MAASSYATTADLSAYLPDVSVTAQSAVWSTYLSVASRFLDEALGQYFYDDGAYVRYFDAAGNSKIDTGQHPFFGKAGTIVAASAGATTLTYTVTYGPVPVVGDVFTLDLGTAAESVTISAVSGTGPYTLTVGATTQAHKAGTTASTINIRLGYFENQPLVSWTPTLAGDGVTPGSNYFLYPRDRPRVGSTVDAAARRPWYGFDIAHIPVGNTSYLPLGIPGYATVAITANWGWPVVPDRIKDVTCRIAARMWRARDTGWTGVIGNVETGITHLRLFDGMDEFLLLASDYKVTYL